MPRPRLLVLASTFPARPGDGVPAFVRDLALQESLEFDTRVLVPRVPGAASDERDGDLHITRYPYFPKRWEDLADGAIIENLRAKPVRWLQVPGLFLAQLVALRRALREFRPDVLHVHWIIPQGVVALLGGRRVPQLVTTLGGDLYALNAAPLRALKARIVRRAGAVTVMNADMRDRVIALGAAPARVQVIPMGADLAPVPASAPAGADEVAAPVPGVATTRLMFVGRLVEKKGLSYLIEAVRRAPAGSLELEIVGDGPLRTALETAASGLPVVFIGQQGRTELFAAYRRADVVVFPSVASTSGDQDGLPVALLEAMRAGRAIIATDLPGLNEVVLDDATGLVVPDRDAAALLRAIQQLADDPDLRARLGAAAATHAEQFSIEAIGSRYRTLLHDVLGAAGRRSSD
ncbi:glycosyltransferase [Plantibacter cousiniae (nom. nud.)]|uniref:glycosyltransferase n=1 Tax=Plantibacter cousiniae (nom. nud.) TaxID=199709 RepID=UPI001DCD0F54|nr:glycosyltransferase [Plantibacter cousiniae]CAH0158790.1 Glycogen synthase [Plantibacter cousiniae]